MHLPRTGQNRSEASIRQRRNKLISDKATNSSKPCVISGCDRHRYCVSTYCNTHAQRYRRYGRAKGPLPTEGELRSIEGAFKEWLDQDHLATDQQRQAFKLAWASGQKTITTNPAFALPFFRLEGNEGFTRQAKGWVILSHYFHVQRHSLSDAMLRLMAVRVWTEFFWQMPEGRRGLTKERNYFVHTWAGYYVLRNSGFTKSKTEEKIIGWERPWYISDDPARNRPKPITEKTIKKVGLTPFKAGPIVRAIGKELQGAVDHAMGTTWINDARLLKRAADALGQPHHK
ncbi:hypothetical protein SAMN05421757_101852 [Tropicimonas sediminicola]|uniref:Uncharacterized protein n=1 Tax=Tropicimonas sediminicola TaxID=1031541 RepID=A0A239DIK9_9RHOB|nr:hypothetical protein SAMN05421757_101852 [Tropicimonas sediminicola]